MGAKLKGFDIGVWTLSTMEFMVRAAKAAEKYGADTFWIAEQFHDRSGLATAMAVAAETKRVKIGMGIVSPFARHPGLLAMEAGTIDEYSKGRFILGLGAARLALLRHGLLHIDIYDGIKESVETIRRLLRLETLIYEGKIFKFAPPGTLLGFKPIRQDLPIYVGGMGPKMFQLAGEIADGLILGMFSSPGLIKFARENLEIGARRVGRDPSNIPLRSFMCCAVAKESQTAKQAVKPVLASYLSENLTYFRFKQAGFTKEEFEGLRSTMRKYIKVWGAGDMTEAVKLISDDLVDRLVIAGTTDECASKIEKWAEAGVDYVIPSHIIGLSVEEGIKTFAKEIIPQVY